MSIHFQVLTIADDAFVFVSLTLLNLTTEVDGFLRTWGRRRTTIHLRIFQAVKWGNGCCCWMLLGLVVVAVAAGGGGGGGRSISLLFLLPYVIIYIYSLTGCKNKTKYKLCRLD